MLKLVAYGPLLEGGQSWMNVVCCFNDEATHDDSTVTMIAIDVSPPRTSRETDPNDGFQLVESRKRKKFSNTSPEINSLPERLRLTL